MEVQNSCLTPEEEKGLDDDRDDRYLFVSCLRLVPANLLDSENHGFFRRTFLRLGLLLWVVPTPRMESLLGRSSTWYR
jgi:hypothetical protein